MYVGMYVCMYACMYVCLYVYVYLIITFFWVMISILILLDGKLQFGVMGVNLHIELSSLVGASEPEMFINPLSYPHLRGSIDRLLARAPFFVRLWTSHRGDQGSTEQAFKVLKHHDVTPPRTRASLPEYALRMGPTIRGKILHAYLSLPQASFIISKDEAMLYSEWNKSGLDWNMERKDKLREMFQLYVACNKDRNFVQAWFSICAPTVHMSLAMITSTMHGSRSFWRDIRELHAWASWVTSRGELPDDGEVYATETMIPDPPRATSNSTEPGNNSGLSANKYTSILFNVLTILST